MPRIKLSEYRSKQLVSRALQLPYAGWSVTVDSSLDQITGDKFVVKVDQAVKQRFKRGLVKLDVAKKDLKSAIKQLAETGYSSFIIEPFIKHASNAERYLSLQRDRSGITISYSQQGGIEIESHSESITSLDFDTADLAKVSVDTELSVEQLQALRQLFDDCYMSFLEINPYVAESKIQLLDVAIEVDSAAALLVDSWGEDDVRSPLTRTSPEEQVVQQLDDESPASFSLEVINPDGAIFLLLSGGGASIVVADEYYSRGHGDKLANYGEYSGNPNTHETKLYADQVLKLLLASKAKQKILFIGGAVANFTDIKATFGGIIESLRDHEVELKNQNITVFVRRGGPNQRAGLDMIERELDSLGILGAVNDPGVSIPAAVEQSLKGFA